MRYGFVIDQDTCIGCHACTVACKTEHDVPLGVNRTWVKYIERGTWPDTSRFFSVMRCNHCTSAPCVTICPTRALFKRDDGIVDFDTSRCIGCKSCMQACPYDAIYIDPGDHTAQKCNYCVHRIEVGLEPACVVVCPEQAIVAGDLDDARSRISRIVANGRVASRAPEQGTSPNVFYKGADAASLDPLAATSLNGGGIWRDGGSPASDWLAVDLTGDGKAGNDDERATSAGEAPRVVYTTDHPAPWGWRVSTYFLTKGIAAGVVLALAVAMLAGGEFDTGWTQWGAPLIATIFLAITGALLVADLKRPGRFHYLLTKANPRSWLVIGAWILTAYAIVLGLWLVAGIAGVDGVLTAIVWTAAPLAIATAGYTAFLFGQAEGRDLWQSPMLLWHMIAGAFAVGGGATLVADLFVSIETVASEAAAWTLIGGTSALGLIALSESFSRHPTRNIAAAVHHLTRGKWEGQWWVGGLIVGVEIPILLTAMTLAGGSEGFAAVAGLAAAAGLWLADDAFVQAGQGVPLS
ncbi:MAG: 4Fe-4S dicluster domain-containing protein [Acidimicrobiia bacterium]